MTGKRTAEAKRWFQQAAYDLKAARWNIQGQFYDTACFLAQQAGEKAHDHLNEKTLRKAAPLAAGP